MSRISVALPRPPSSVGLPRGPVRLPSPLLVLAAPAFPRNVMIMGNYEKKGK